MTVGSSARMRSSLRSWWWRDTPRFARRFYWRTMLVGMPLYAALLGMMLLTGSARRMGLVGLGAFCAVAAVLISLWVIAVGRWETRLVQRLQAAACKLCPRCGYDLTGHDGLIDCPECGTALDLDEVTKAWQSFRPRISGERV